MKQSDKHVILYSTCATKRSQDWTDHWIIFALRVDGNCFDFMTEETALQLLGYQLGAQVMLTSKFHCEFAGEGIEYA